jgi:hypothetical protein
MAGASIACSSSCDRVQQGQPLIELSNTNLALSVIQRDRS